LPGWTFRWRGSSLFQGTAARQYPALFKYSDKEHNTVCLLNTDGGFIPVLETNQYCLRRPMCGYQTPTSPSLAIGRMEQSPSRELADARFNQHYLIIITRNCQIILLEQRLMGGEVD